MSEISSPRTPAPEVEINHENETPPSEPCKSDGSQETNLKYISPPPPQASGDLTPPPSAQIPTPVAKPAYTDPNKKKHAPDSPPPTHKLETSAFPNRLFGEVPTTETVQNFDEEQLRGLVAELLPALSEARMSAAHSKLQYSLLSIENAESMKRAEVEHEMTRREVQVLQECYQAQRGSLGYVNSPHSPQSATQRHLDLALKYCRELQNDNALLERRLRQAKKLILQLDGRNAELLEDNHHLRQRIQQNREHLNNMRSSGAISVHGTPLADFGTPLPRNNPRTPLTARTNLDVKPHVGSQDPFDALLFAGQVLNGETNSGPPSPSQTRAKKLRSSHNRGAHSLSSLPVTPSRSRPITADGTVFTPINRLVAEHRVSCSAPNTQLTYNTDDRRHERDSTISASDNEEEAYTDVDVPASQASQRAASMLRPASGQEIDRVETIGSLSSSKKVTQAKIFGLVKKAGVNRSESQRKRGGDVNTYDELVRSAKRTKTRATLPERIGLGIANWSSPRR